MLSERLQQQVTFLMEIDKVKQVFRRSFLTDKSRNENDAEHSWHLAVYAILLAEYSKHDNLDLLKVLRMILIHDLVEIDAGDTFAYDVKGYEDKAEREEKAAKRIFGLLPNDQGEEFYQLWTEFEEMQTIEAKYAASLDRLQPLLQNYFTQGASWQEHNITSAMVLERNKHIRDGSEELWSLVEYLVEESVKNGYLIRS
ncbi:HD domain-containing protein [Bacillus horti]|uniref:5'-deoxynucleotidase n=2 Tax=Caldalkalibacillus horti TaxID=77523 RepID=A0ABT9VWC1_9BACI|nr:HD domain-containing protein [Bacillus horti]MDQ0165273.1 putative hydrolase of HD superfamily [Bacillus horti]